LEKTTTAYTAKPGPKIFFSSNLEPSFVTGVLPECRRGWGSNKTGPRFNDYYGEDYQPVFLDLLRIFDFWLMTFHGG